MAKKPTTSAAEILRDRYVENDPLAESLCRGRAGQRRGRPSRLHRANRGRLDTRTINEPCNSRRPIGLEVSGNHAEIRINPT